MRELEIFQNESKQTGSGDTSRASVVRQGGGACGRGLA